MARVLSSVLRCAVGVFDAQQELAAVLAGVEPVEERGAGAADVQEARGGGAKRTRGRFAGVADDMDAATVRERRTREAEADSDKQTRARRRSTGGPAARRERDSNPR
jgi:hypothetical protein